MTDKYSRSFEGVWIPANIWLTTTLTLQEKAFLVEITSLDNEHGCFASNEYFSGFFQLSKSRCSEVINKLKEKGLISIENTYKPGTKQISKRVIRVNRYHEIFTGVPIRHPEEGIRESEEGIRKTEEGIRHPEAPPSGLAKDNNTFINNTFNNTNNNTREREEKKSTPLTAPAPLQNDFENIQKFFKQNFRNPTYQDDRDLDKLYEFYPDGRLIIEAMTIALKNEKPYISYVQKILYNWSTEKGIDTYNDFLKKGGQQDASDKHSHKRPSNDEYDGLSI